MAKSSITTNVIDSIVSNPEKLNDFKVYPRKNYGSESEYISLLSRAIFTLISFPENARTFTRMNELKTNSIADITYLIEVLTQTPEFKNYEFRVVPIIKLYEALLRENWETVKADRDVLDTIESTKITPESNVQICTAIANFLKEYILEKSHNPNI